MGLLEALRGPLEGLLEGVGDVWVVFQEGSDIEGHLDDG